MLLYQMQVLCQCERRDSLLDEEYCALGIQPRDHMRAFLLTFPSSTTPIFQYPC